MITYIRPVGTAFIKLISMVVVPLVFVALLVGTASLKDIRSLGRIGVRTLVLYLSMTAIAVTIGLTLANVVRPGAGFSQETKQQLIEGGGTQASTPRVGPALNRPSIKDLLLNIIPANPVRSLAEGEMLQIDLLRRADGHLPDADPAGQGPSRSSPSSRAPTRSSSRWCTSSCSSPPTASSP